MMGLSETPIYFEVKAILTVDIVGFSARPVEQMVALISQLLRVLEESIPPGREEAYVWSPAGDGGSLTFDDVRDAYQVALRLSELVQEASEGLPEDEKLKLRMGLHAGTVVQAEDLDGRPNIWGDGINYSSRIVDIAKPGQILASQKYCEDSGLINSNLQPVRSDISVKYVGKRWVKHNTSLELYNINTSSAGIPVTAEDAWYESFQAPFTGVLSNYQSMLEAHRNHPGLRNVHSLRLAAICKRLLELDKTHQPARDVLRDISHANSRENTNAFHFFLSFLSPEAIEYLLEKAHFVQWRRGDVIFSQGDEAAFLIIILSGEVEVTIEGTSYHGTFVEGEIVGEMGLFRPSQTRQATVTALQDLTCLKIEYHHLVLPDILENGDYSTQNFELRYRKRIVEEIWRQIYAKRSVENTLNSHPIFKDLSYGEKQELVNQAEIYPERFESAVFSLDSKTMWEHLLVVVEGEVLIQAKFGLNEFSVNYYKEDCITLAKLHLDYCPYDKVFPYDGTHLVIVPWDALEFIWAENQVFRQQCESFFEYFERPRWLGAV